MRNFGDENIAGAPEERPVLPSLGELVASRLRAARKASGLTLAEVAAHCGSTPQTIQRLETNNMTLSIGWVERIAEAIGIDPYLLFTEIDGSLMAFERRVAKFREEADVLRVRTEGFLSSIDQFLKTDEAAS